MNLPIDTGKDCARAWEAMPWALQENNPQGQHEWLMEHLAQCESCRAEFEQQSRLRMAISLPSDVPVDVEAGLRRLMSRLDTTDADDMPTRARPTSWVTRALVAAVLVQAVGIGVLGARLWSEQEAHQPYRTLSQNAPPAAPGAIHVVPDATMKLADWNALLHELQLQVTRGPNAVGAYTVVPANGASSSPDTLRKLRASRGIRLAEPVAPPP
ncbi:hypothetical protein SAMN05216570_4213 [Dyella sp. OK004]|uniref:anti-sigma factor family protein n=1 Tax=Dyella sp. OK004 TaxID=1855292 RepID=UPI0008DF2DCA|nr:hypothetical protein [Dyella sp. OK004]SFS19974.1 hypothetical protein SAMN05216570_4213 [Dyella sp. OK004]